MLTTMHVSMVLNLRRIPLNTAHCHTCSQLLLPTPNPLCACYGHGSHGCKTGKTKQSLHETLRSSRLPCLFLSSFSLKPIRPDRGRGRIWSCRISWLPRTGFCLLSRVANILLQRSEYRMMVSGPSPYTVRRKPHV